MHGARWCAQAAATAVLEGFTGFEQWLMPDHTQAFDLFGVTRGVNDDPVAGDQLRGHCACVVHGDGVGESVAVLFGVRLLGNVLRSDGNFKFVGRHSLLVYL